MLDINGEIQISLGKLICYSRMSDKELGELAKKYAILDGHVARQLDLIHHEIRKRKKFGLVTADEILRL